MDFILTNDGAAVMTEAASGKDLVLTRAESGTGYSSAPATLSAVSGKQQDLDIEEVTFENQETRITVFLSNRLLETGYNLRQIGIYGKIAGSDQDVLMIVGQQYSGEPIHPISDGEEECRYNVLMKVSGTSSITVEGGSGSLATKRELLNHTENKKNPHNVSAEQVGLGNVPNVKTDDQTPTVEMASDRANIEKGDTFKTIVGKMMKWFADLKTGAFSSVANNLLTTLAGSVLDARQGKVLKENIDAVDTKVTELSTNLIDIYVGEDGKLHKVKGGADSVLPFSSGLLILSCRLKNSKGCKYSPTYFSNVSISYASSKQVVTLSVLKDIKGILAMNVHVTSAYQMKFSSSSGESSITKNSLSMSQTYTNAPDYDFDFKQGDTVTFTLDNTGSYFILDIYVCSIAEDLVQTTG